jgi:hypothetical protein
LEFDPTTELLKIPLPLTKQEMRVGERYFPKSNPISRSKLRRYWQIYGDHVSDFWITADGLAIPHKQNWIAVGRYLDGSRRDRLRHQIKLIGAFELYSFQPNAHPVGSWRDRENFAR